MSYLDSSEHDDGPPRRGRSRRAARPAWDAATYGVPEDLRRSRSARSDRDARDREPDPYASESDRYQPDPPYQAEPAYQADQYPYPDPAPTTTYAPPPSPLPTELKPLDGYPQAPSYRSDPYRYDPGPASYDSSPSSYDSSPSSYDPGPPSYEPPKYDPPAYPTEPYPGQSQSQPYESLPYELDPPASYAPPVETTFGPAPDRYPGGLDSDDADDGEASDGGRRSQGERSGRAGRNMPAAIGVGVLLAGIALSSLFLWRPAFFAVIAVAVGVGVWELVRAVRTNGFNPPLIPLVVGGALMTGLAWRGQADWLTFGLIITVLAAMAWRLSDGAGGYGRDITAATLVAVYVPFLAGFAALLASPADGDKRVLVTLALIVLSDTGGFVAGVLFGRHPMAPSVSPKKSWEGLAGSFVACGVGGAVLLATIFDASWWAGALFGFAIAVAATLGDLGESMIKRDLGVKDMSNLLPGHGGLMDRLDSILVAAPTAYVIFAMLVPPT